LQVNSFTGNAAGRHKPLILLNDKRFGLHSERDRRMILNIDEVAANLTAMYPDAEVKVIRFRDLALAQQIKWLARAKVFITTQASSSFGLVFYYSCHKVQPASWLVRHRQATKQCGSHFMSWITGFL